MPKIQENKGLLFVTVPKEIANIKGWKKGQTILFSIDDLGKVIMQSFSTRESQYKFKWKPHKGKIGVKSPKHTQ